MEKEWDEKLMIATLHFYVKSAIHGLTKGQELI
jgi:hypothetical protein